MNSYSENRTNSKFNSSGNDNKDEEAPKSKDDGRDNSAKTTKLMIFVT